MDVRRGMHIALVVAGVAMLATGIAAGCARGGADTAFSLFGIPGRAPLWQAVAVLALPALSAIGFAVGAFRSTPSDETPVIDLAAPILSLTMTAPFLIAFIGGDAVEATPMDTNRIILAVCYLLIPLAGALCPVLPPNRFSGFRLDGFMYGSRWTNLQHFGGMALAAAGTPIALASTLEVNEAVTGLVAMLGVLTVVLATFAYTELARRDIV